MFPASSYTFLYDGSSLCLFFWTIFTTLIFWLLKRNPGRPKNWSPPRLYEDEVPRKSHVSVRQDNFSASKIPKDLDVIIIGSGIGGLTCGSVLAKNGKRVLVLEQHYIAGGCTHTFDENGFEHETGVHYIGNVHKRKAILDLLSEKPIEWQQMGTCAWEDGQGVYDEFIVNGESFPLRAGKANFTADMCRRFPDHEQQIRDYVDLVEMVAKDDFFFNVKIVKPKCFRRLLQRFGNKGFQQYNRPVIEVLRNDLGIKNPKLLAVLRANHSDYGSPTKSSFIIHAQVVHHYFGGGFYPEGGSAVFAEGLIPTIEHAGGRVLVRKGVKEILINKKSEAHGVRMENGMEIYAPIVISACGVNNTYGKLLDHCPKWICDFQGLMKDVGPSIKFFYLFLGFDLSPEEAKMRSCNHWVLPCGDSYDLEALNTNFCNDPENAPIPLFIASGSAKDPDFATRYPGKSTAVIIACGEMERYEEFRKQKSGKRDVEYTELKEVVADRLLKEFLKMYPHLEDHIVQSSISTPATTAHYLGYPDGEVYGLDCPPERFHSKWKLECDTEIPGLYMTGQDITTLGFTGAMMAGILTAMCIEGYVDPLDMIRHRDLITDLMAMEKNQVHVVDSTQRRSEDKNKSN